MPAPLIPLVLLGLGAAGLGWASLQKRPGPSGGAVAKDLAKRVANEGPKGEWVFKPEIAGNITKSLAGQAYAYYDANIDDTVQIQPDPRGLPIAFSNTALAWCRQQNDTKSILAPLYMATTSPQRRFLRAVPSGREEDYTGPETGFAVLLYAGTLAADEAPPGRPPGGGAIKPLPAVIPDAPKPGLPNLPAPGTVPTPGGGGVPSPPSGGFPGGLSPASFIPGAEDALKGSVKQALDDLCANGRDPVAMEAVAAEADKFGFTSEAACLRARASQLRAQQQPPPAPPPLPGPSPTVFVPGVIPPPAPQVPPPVLTPQFAIVTTNDPPPAGDLIIRATPSMSGPVRQFPQGTGSPNQIGGAHKNGTVAVLSKVSSGGIDWAEIQWNGDPNVRMVNGVPNNWPAARGFAKAQFLRPTAQAPVAPAPAVIPGGLPGLLPAINPGALTPRARVTTNDPAPAGDLILRATPSMSGPVRSFPQGQGAANQIGGAEKNGLVDLVGAPVSAEGILWQQVRWAGGSRWPAATGFAKAQFLTPVSPTTISGREHTLVDGEGRRATVVSSSGMRLRSAPGPNGKTLSLIPSGAQVQLLQVAPGPKGDLRSPGPGGWAMVRYSGRPGWVQSEWLLI